MACHSDKRLTTKRGARTVSLFVDGKKFSSSVHSGLSCTSCHADLDGKDLPHSTPLAKVNCGASIARRRSNTLVLCTARQLLSATLWRHAV